MFQTIRDNVLGYQMIMCIHLACLGMLYLWICSADANRLICVSPLLLKFNRLHEEIEQFYEYLKPTPAERLFRDQIVKRFKSILLDLWPEAYVGLVGSIPTALDFPSSDIDFELLRVNDELALHILKDKLLSLDIAEPASLRLIQRNSLSIVTVLDRESHLDIDFSFNDTVSLQSTKFINDYMKHYPALPKLIFVLKQFLTQRHLKRIKTGSVCTCRVVLQQNRFAFFPVGHSNENRCWFNLLFLGSF